MTTMRNDVRRHQERLRLSPTLTPTPMETGLKETVAWWREQEGTND